MEKITEFKGKYYFLSNFYNYPVTYDGILYKNSEAAFQSAKCINKEDRLQFCDLTASRAKSLGRMVKLREDWESVKYDIMYEILLDKFKPGTELAKMLIETGDAILIEGNDWHDTYWGVDITYGIGENNLGKILMKIRASLKSQSNA